MPQATHRRPGAARVMVVDDEPGVRRSLERVFESEGYDVESAGSGEEALSVLRRRTCDVIVCDLRMPAMSGAELHTLVKIEFPELAGRMIFTSGDLYDPAAQSFLAASGAPALQKPFQTPALLSLVTECLPVRTAVAGSQRRAS